MTIFWKHIASTHSLARKDLIEHNSFRYVSTQRHGSSTAGRDCGSRNQDSRNEEGMHPNAWSSGDTEAAPLGAARWQESFASCRKKKKKNLLPLDFQGQKGKWLRVCIKFLCGWQWAEKAELAIRATFNGQTHTSSPLEAPSHFHCLHLLPHLRITRSIQKKAEWVPSLT